MRNLYDIIMSRGVTSANGEEEDSMFTKKPWGGMSCAACEKDVVNMYGKRVEYMPWGKMPFKDPTERISRVGQGFSKMLSSLKPESITYEIANVPNTTVNSASMMGSTMGATFNSDEQPSEIAPQTAYGSRRK